LALIWNFENSGSGDTIPYRGYVALKPKILNTVAKEQYLDNNTSIEEVKVVLFDNDDGLFQ